MVDLHKNGIVGECKIRTMSYIEDIKLNAFRADGHKTPVTQRSFLLEYSIIHYVQ